MTGPAWIYISIGAALVAVGAAGVWWALLADRARGRARCPRCWYAMAGLQTLTCPECGKTVRDERGLMRTRRRWVRAALFVVVLSLGVATVCVPRFQVPNPWTQLPTWALLLAEDVVGVGAVKNLSSAREDRLFAAGLSDGAVRALVMRDKKVWNGRTVWPEGMEYRGIANWHSASSLRNDVVDYVAVALPDHTPRQHFQSNRSGGYGCMHPFQVGFDDGTRPLELREDAVELIVRRDKMWASSGDRWPGATRPVPITMTIRRVPSVDDILAPVFGPDVDEEVKELISLQFRVLPPWNALVGIDGDQKGTLLEGVTIGFSLDVRFRNSVVATVRGWQRQGAPQIEQEVPCFYFAKDCALAAADPTDPDWDVVFRGDGEQALRDIDGTRYWKGSFTMPLSEVMWLRDR